MSHDVLRRVLLATLASLALVLAAAGPVAAQRLPIRGVGPGSRETMRRVQVPSGRPNVLIVLTDDQRPDGVGYAGNASLRTPNLDRLASEGARLENFYVATPQCCPSRARRRSRRT